MNSKKLLSTRKRRFISMGDGTYVDITTDKIIGSKEEVMLLLKQEEELLRSEKELLKEPEENKLCLNWNTNDVNNSPKLFSKSYKVFQREVSSKMSVNELALMAIFTMHLESGTNRVVVNGKDPSNKELGECMNVKITTISTTISKLRKKNLVKTTGSGMGRKIYVNPKWTFDGKHLDVDTYNLFFENK